MNRHSDELVKLVIAEKDKAKLKYKQRMNDIKQHYGIEFDVIHYQDEKIKDINFVNLKYKDKIENISITYDNITKKIDYINYEFSDTKLVKNLNHKKMITFLEKEYKLKLVIDEMNRINIEYIQELAEIDYALKNTENDLQIEKVLKNNKDDEN